MLELTIQPTELYDEEKNLFISVPKPQLLKLEHSLISISKWESKWCKPFLNTTKTVEQTLDYVRCMITNAVNDPNVCYCLSREDIKTINGYINAPMSATYFNDKALPRKRGGSSGEIVTSEVVYYWMVAFRIPREFEKWHFNRLINLIKICEIKSQPAKKMKRGDILRQNAELNARRLAQFNTKG